MRWPRRSISHSFLGLRKALTSGAGRSFLEDLPQHLLHVRMKRSATPSRGSPTKAASSVRPASARSLKYRTIFGPQSYEPTLGRHRVRGRQHHHGVITAAANGPPGPRAPGLVGRWSTRTKPNPAVVVQAMWRRCPEVRFGASNHPSVSLDGGAAAPPAAVSPARSASGAAPVLRQTFSPGAGGLDLDALTSERAPSVITRRHPVSTQAALMSVWTRTSTRASRSLGGDRWSTGQHR